MDGYDADLEELKHAAARIDFADTAAVALLIMRSIPTMFPACIDGEGCEAASMAETLAFHFKVDKRHIRVGLSAAVEQGRLEHTEHGTPVMLKLGRRNFRYKGS